MNSTSTSNSTSNSTRRPSQSIGTRYAAACAARTAAAEDHLVARSAVAGVLRPAIQAALAAIVPGSRGAPARRAAITAGTDPELRAVLTADATVCAARADLARARRRHQRVEARTQAAIAAGDATLARASAAIDRSDLRTQGGAGVAFGACGGCHVERTLDWSEYRRRRSVLGPTLVVDLSVSIAYDWAETVEADALAVVEGLPTIQAQRIDGLDGVDAWTATWLGNGRGYATELRRGVILRRAGVTVHAATVEQGVRRLRRAG